MNEKDEIKLDVLSGIDDDIIDKQSQKRYVLMTRKRRSNKKWIIWLSSAACFLAALCVFFFVILPFLTPVVGPLQTPIYEGMTVSNTPPTPVTQVNTSHRFGKPMLLTLSTCTYKNDYGLVLLDGEATSPTETKPSGILNLPEVEGTDRARYYANSGEDIYITVHFNNPDQFEILSFTLNGLKYQSYMFEKGSDSENLILKVNVGDVEGMVEYTIDAIKYVDGDTIKDVLMEGEKTVTVGVRPAEQPSSKIENEVSDFDSVTFDVAINDAHSLIKDCDGKVYVLLLDGDRILEQKQIPTGLTTSLSFEGLRVGTVYKRAIIGYFDALDGQGFTSHVLAESEIVTRASVKITDVTVHGSSVTFDVSAEDDSQTVIQKIELINQDDTVVLAGDAATRSFDFEAQYIGTYRVSVTYTYRLNGVEKSDVVISSESVTMSMSGVTDIVPHGEVYKPYTVYTSIYNETTLDWRTHPGLDIIPTTDDHRVLSASWGTVTGVYQDEAYGYTVEVTTPDGTLTICYKSLIESSVTLKIGDAVAGGDLIGEMSDSSLREFADPYHLHLEMYENGEEIDPGKYVPYVNEFEGDLQ